MRFEEYEEEIEQRNNEIDRLSAFENAVTALQEELDRKNEELGQYLSKLFMTLE